MKKKIVLSLALVMSLTGLSLSAQDVNDNKACDKVEVCDKAPKCDKASKCDKEKKDFKKGPRFAKKGRPEASLEKKCDKMLEGITLTPEQQAKVDALFASKAPKHCLGDSANCQQKADCKKADCKKADCKKEDCKKEDCKKADCKKADCKKADCKKEDCKKADCKKEDCKKADMVAKSKKANKEAKCEKLEVKEDCGKKMDSDKAPVVGGPAGKKARVEKGQNQRAEMISEMKEILTPEQYVIFLENIAKYSPRR